MGQEHEHEGHGHGGHGHGHEGPPGGSECPVCKSFTSVRDGHDNWMYTGIGGNIFRVSHWCADGIWHVIFPEVDVTLPPETAK